MTLDQIRNARPAADATMPRTQQLDSLLFKYESIRAELRPKIQTARQEAGKARTQHQLKRITRESARGAIEKVIKLESDQVENERIIADLLKQRADAFFIESGAQKAEMKRQYVF